MAYHWLSFRPGQQLGTQVKNLGVGWPHTVPRRALGALVLPSACHRCVTEGRQGQGSILSLRKRKVLKESPQLYVLELYQYTLQP